MIRSALVLVLTMCSVGFSQTPDAIVAQDGSGKYTSVRAALDAAPQITHDDGHRWTILIKPGVYTELLDVQREKRFVSLVGVDEKKPCLRMACLQACRGQMGNRSVRFTRPVSASMRMISALKI